MEHDGVVTCDGCPAAFHRSCYLAAYGAAIPDGDGSWLCLSCAGQDPGPSQGPSQGPQEVMPVPAAPSPSHNGEDPGNQEGSRCIDGGAGQVKGGGGSHLYSYLDRAVGSVCGWWHHV